MKNTMFITAVLAAMICATTAWGQTPPPRGPGGPRGMNRPPVTCPATVVMPPPAGAIDHVAESLGLTEDQTTKLKATLTKCDESMRSLSQKAADATKAFRDALVASEYDEQNVKNLAATAEKAEAAIISARIDEWTQIRSVLTADQTKKLQEMTMQQPRPDQRPGQGPCQRPGGPPPGQDQ